jgi:hypothetical protein
VRLRRQLIPALAAAVASVLAPAAASAQAPVDPAAGLVIRPLDADPTAVHGDPAGRSVTDHVEPGAVVERRIEVSNVTDRPLTVNLYAADATIDEGWHTGDGPGTSEVVSWLIVAPPLVTIAPGTRATGSILIEVPEGTDHGERYAAIVAETAEVVERSEGAPRAELRVYLSVGGPEEPPIDFLIDELTPGRDETGAPVVRLGVDNTGGRAVDLTGTLELVEGPDGRRAGPFPISGPFTLAPEQHGTVEIPLDGRLPAGPWRAVARLAAGAEERGTDAVLDFPRVGMGMAVTAGALPDRGVLFPVTLGLVLLVMVVALAVLRQWRDRTAGAEAAAVAPEVARNEPAGMA